MSANIHNNMPVKMVNNDESPPDHLFCSLDQVIIVEHEYNVPIKRMLLEITKVVDSKDVLLITDYSLGYLIFLKSEKIAEQLFAMSKCICNINIIRPFIIDLIQIRFRKISPLIPHRNIQKAFEKLNIYSVQDLSFVNRGYIEDSLCHIVSAEREGYILYSDLYKIKKNILHIEFDNKIYISSFDIKCSFHSTKYHDPRFCKYHPTKVMESLFS